MCVCVWNIYHKRILFIHKKKKKKENPATYSMDGPWGYYAAWNKPNKYTVWPHLYIELKNNNTKLREKKSDLWLP